MLNYYGFPKLRELAFLIPPLLSWRLATLEGVMDLLNSLNIHPQKILDVGCAAGFFSKRLARLFPNAEITAIDLSPPMIEFARRNSQNFKNLCFTTADTFQFDRSDFDLTTAFYLLMVTGVERTIPRLLETVRLGGLLLVNMTSFTPLTTIHFHFYKILNRSELDLMSPEKFRRIAERHGKIVKLVELSETEGSYLALLRRTR
ncbi:MAG: hypothetical protein DRQ10_08785 [Candidatus Hydrothermota bacterium]|nr:MAG: hypothetical protein DRQ10_08785 [Candidatus Hydrothermae bacterium]